MKNEKMSSPCTSRLALQSGLQALREIGKPVAASEEELPRWWPRYGPVSFLIAFWSTLCTICTLVHCHIIYKSAQKCMFYFNVHFCALCARYELRALKNTELTNVHRSARFVDMCTSVHSMHFVHYVHFFENYCALQCTW